MRGRRGGWLSLAVLSAAYWAAAGAVALRAYRRGYAHYHGRSAAPPGAPEQVLGAELARGAAMTTGAAALAAAAILFILLLAIGLLVAGRGSKGRDDGAGPRIGKW